MLYLGESGEKRQIIDICVALIFLNLRLILSILVVCGLFFVSTFFYIALFGPEELTTAPESVLL